MALLAFEDTRSSPVADLMDISQRQKTASELNAAILSSQCQVRTRHARPLLLARIYTPSSTTECICSKCFATVCIQSTCP